MKTIHCLPTDTIIDAWERVQRYFSVYNLAHEVNLLFDDVTFKANRLSTINMLKFYHYLAKRKSIMSTPTPAQTNQFDLQRAMAGEAIETVEGRPRVFIAYRTDRRERLRLVVLDPIADKLYSHYANGEHCEQVRSLALRMKPKARRKVTRYIVTEMQGSVRYLFGVLYENESDARLKAETVKDGQVHAITVEVDA